MVNLVRAIGPTIAGVSSTTVGNGWCFRINSICFAFVRARRPCRHSPEPAHDHAWPTPRRAPLRRAQGPATQHDHHDGGHRTPDVREFQVSLPLMADDAFHGHSITYGLLTSFMGRVTLWAGLVVAGRRSRATRARQHGVGLGHFVLIACFIPTLVLEEIVPLFVGAGSLTFMSLANSTIQLEAGPAMHGRVIVDLVSRLPRIHLHRRVTHRPCRSKLWSSIDPGGRRHHGAGDRSRGTHQPSSTTHWRRSRNTTNPRLPATSAALTVRPDRAVSQLVCF